MLLLTIIVRVSAPTLCPRASWLEETRGDKQSKQRHTCSSSSPHVKDSQQRGAHHSTHSFAEPVKDDTNSTCVGLSHRVKPVVPSRWQFAKASCKLRHWQTSLIYLYMLSKWQHKGFMCKLDLSRSLYCRSTDAAVAYAG
eukprot:5637952-Amphidinium_carterae.1